MTWWRLRITVKAYYKGFKSLYGAITGALGSLPLVAIWFPDKASAYLFPPLDRVYGTIAIGLCVLVTIAIYFSADLKFINSAKRRFDVLLALIGVAAIGAVLFLACSTRFVRTIDIPATGDSITVSVGFERTNFANVALPNSTDWELLRARGTSEEEIQKLWTPSSVIWARIALLVTYLLFLLPAVGVGSLAVLCQESGPPMAR